MQFFYAYVKSMYFHASICTKLINDQRHFSQISFTEFHSKYGKHKYKFVYNYKQRVPFAVPIFTKLKSRSTFFFTVLRRIFCRLDENKKFTLFKSRKVWFSRRRFFKKKLFNGNVCILLYHVSPKSRNAKENVRTATMFLFHFPQKCFPKTAYFPLIS